MENFSNGYINPPLHLQEHPNTLELRRLLWNYTASENPQNAINAMHFVEDVERKNGICDTTYTDSEMGSKLAALAHKMKTKTPSNMFRLYPINGWNTLSRTYRQSGQYNKVLSLDLVNCHASILHAMYPTKIHLREYVENRESCLQKVASYYHVDRTLAKQLYSRIEYGGSERAWCHEHCPNAHKDHLLEGFSNDCRSIQADLVNKYPHWFNEIRATPSHPPSNPAACLMSYILMYEERRIINSLKNHFHDRTQSILYDEINITCNDNPQKDLREAQTIVKKINPTMDIKIATVEEISPPLPYENEKNFQISSVSKILDRYKRVSFKTSDGRKKHCISLATTTDRIFTNDQDPILFIPNGFKENAESTTLEGVNFLTKMLPLFNINHYMNGFFAKCKDLIYQFTYLENDIVDTVDIFTVQTFVNSYQEEFTSYEPEKINQDDMTFYKYKPVKRKLGTYWISTMGLARSINGIGLYFPGETVPTNFVNIFSGLPATPRDSQEASIVASVAIIMQHQREIICNGDEAFFAYYQNWIAKLLQFKGKNIALLVMVSSHQQVGKGVMWDQKGLYARILGEKYYYKPTSRLTDSEGLLGGFNYGHHNRLLIYLDEVSNYAGAIQANNQLKQFMSTPVVTYKMKNKQAIELADRACLVITSNEDTCVRIEKEDARTAITSVSNKYSVSNAKNNVDGMTMEIRSAYFKKLAHAVENPLVRSAILYYYQNLDIQDMLIPDTELRQTAQKFVQNPVLEFVNEWAQGDSQIDSAFCSHSMIRKTEEHNSMQDLVPNMSCHDTIRVSDLWRIFVLLWKRKNVQHALTRNKFTSHLASLRESGDSVIEHVYSKKDAWGGKNCSSYRLKENTWNEDNHEGMNDDYLKSGNHAEQVDLCNDSESSDNSCL